MRSHVAVFFDIDGTLLSVNGAGRMAFSRAIESVFGWQDAIEYIQFAGATDLGVLHRIAEVQNQSLDANAIHRFFERLPVELEQSSRETTPSLFPGVHRLIEALASREHCLLGLITGNEERCAKIKLGLFRLDHHFQFGAYGNEHADRVDIALLAEQRLRERTAPRFPGARFLVGDTPSDMVAARAIGACAVGVATGSYGHEALLEAGADHVLDSLDDTAGILELLGA